MDQVYTNTLRNAAAHEKLVDHIYFDGWKEDLSSGSEFFCQMLNISRQEFDTDESLLVEDLRHAVVTQRAIAICDDPMRLRYHLLLADNSVIGLRVSEINALRHFDLLQQLVNLIE